MNGCLARAAACSSITSASVRGESGDSRASGKPYFAKRQSCPSRSNAMKRSLTLTADGYFHSAFVRLAVLPEQDPDVADHTDQLGAGLHGQLAEDLLLLLLGGLEADLDQLVRHELGLGLRDHRLGQPFLADHHDRLQRVGEPAQVAPLKAVELIHVRLTPLTCGSLRAQTLASSLGTALARPSSFRAQKVSCAPMYRDRRVVVVMPAYNAEKTLRRTYDEVMAQGIVDHLIVVDDASRDATVQVASELPRTTVRVHEQNRGYGGNQKTCYQAALEAGADVVVMVHPDYQYTPKLLPAMVALVGGDVYPCVLGSRILGGGALKGGMPIWKYVANRALTLTENWLLGSKLSEFHTGYRAFKADLLRELPLEANSDDFVFDNQMLAQILWYGYEIAEITCPTAYFAEASSINLSRSVRYGFGCLGTGLEFRLARWGLRSSARFPLVAPG